MSSYIVSYALANGFGHIDITTKYPLAPKDMNDILKNIQDKTGQTNIVILNIFKFEREDE